MTDKIDWTSIERDYREGSMPVREMARWYQISEGAIRKRAKSKGWPRADEKSTQQPARTKPEPVAVKITALTPVSSDPKTIVGRGKNLVLRLLDELDAVTTHAGELDQMICDETEDDQNGKRRAAMLKAVELPSRSNTIRSLALAYKTFAEAGAPLGKKAELQEAAETAGAGSEWGDDLGPSALN